MLMRVMVGVVALPLLLCILYFAPVYILPIFLAAVVMLGIYEMLISTGIVKNRFLLIITELFGVAVVAWSYLSGDVSSVIPFVFLFGTFLFAIAMSDRKSVGFMQITGCFFAAIFLPLMITSILRIRLMDNGIYLVILPFLTAWMTDTGAYFTGYFFGKHKFAPHISPSKTIEGCVGGLVYCIVFMFIYGAVVDHFWGVEMSCGVLLIIGVVCAAIAEFGDLSMSLIKREFGIKDYGTIMPGHGGVLDRFDSVLFTAPAVELILLMAEAII